MINTATAMRRVCLSGSGRTESDNRNLNGRGLTVGAGARSEVIEPSVVDQFLRVASPSAERSDVQYRLLACIIYEGGPSVLIFPVRVAVLNLRVMVDVGQGVLSRFARRVSGAV